MTTRLDVLLTELSARHGNGREFLTAVRPLAARILAPDTPEERRPALLEALAETCERDAAVRRNCAEAKAAARQGFGQLRAAIEPWLGRRRNGR